MKSDFSTKKRVCQNEGKGEDPILTHPLFYFSLNSVGETPSLALK